MIEKIIWKIFCKVFKNRISDKIDYVILKNTIIYNNSEYYKGYKKCCKNIKKDLIKTFEL